MDIKKRTLTATEESVLKNDLIDVEVWVNSAIDGKVANCKKRMIAEWLPKLYADESVTQIPANENDMIAMVVARNDYLDRSDRQNGHPSGEPADSWTEAQLQTYCSKHSVAWTDEHTKAQLLTKAKAKYEELNG
jgi:hypothetical protein